jgi:hypothetical protein
MPRLEGRRSIQLSYGRPGFLDSKPFAFRTSLVLDGLTLGAWVPLELRERIQGLE